MIHLRPSKSISNLASNPPSMIQVPAMPDHRPVPEYEKKTFLIRSWRRLKKFKSIQSVTKLNRYVTSGTASQEINFWLTFERALESIEAELRSDEVSMVMPLLASLLILDWKMLLMKASSFNIPKNVKIAHAPSDLCLVHKYNQLLKDFPLEWAPLCHRPRQDPRIPDTDFWPYQSKTSSIFSSRLTCPPPRRSYLAWLQWPTSAHPNISATPLHAS